jgi:anti-sigma B factor antagonist
MPVDGYELRRIGQHGIVTVPAEVDVTNSGEVREALLAAVSQGVPVLIIDMSETTFCDSTGVHAIVAAHQRAAANGTGLRLVATEVLHILTVVGVDQLIPVYPDLEAALAARSLPALG